MANIFGNMAKVENKMIELIAFTIVGFILCMCGLALFRVNFYLALILALFSVGFWAVFLGLVVEMVKG